MFEKKYVPGLTLLLCLVNSVLCDWSAWSQWGTCTVSCGQGIRRRYRICENQPLMAGVQWCPGNPRQTENCLARFPCAIDGGWSEWSSWSPCSVTCGQGERRRLRECNNPAPTVNGRLCDGDVEDIEQCKNLNGCPRDGGWSSWSAWSSCSVTCGNGLRARYRSCTNPPPAADGKLCEGKGKQESPCGATKPCPVNGQWSEWTDWTECSVTCGTGQRQRIRSCDNPPAQHGGSPCNNTELGHIEIRECNATFLHCPVDGSWSEWSDWGTCETADCNLERGSSYSFRHRSCNTPVPKHNGSMCLGAFLDAGICGQPMNCKVDGNWSEWGEWSCTPTLAKRTRACDSPPPANGGRPCPPDGVAEFFSNDEDGYNNVCGDSSQNEEENATEDYDYY